MNAQPDDSLARPDPSTQRGASGGVSVVLAVVAVVSCLLLAGFMMLSGPAFRRIFEDFDTELPRLTVVLMSPLAPAAVVAFALATAIKEPLVRSKRLAIGWNVLAIGLAVIMTQVYVMALLLPLLVTIESLT
jgi:hypothetical protein